MGKNNFKISQEVVLHMMDAAQAHKEASVVCVEESDKQHPLTTRAFYLGVVSFEQLLLSVEQSMKLSLMLYFSHKPEPNHRIDKLLDEIIAKDGNSKKLLREILNSANKIGATASVPTISEDEVKNTIKRHRSSYTKLRYFGLDTQFNVSSDNKWEISGRDIQVMHCMAWGLIDVNTRKIGDMGMKIRPLMGVARKIPESEMTDELKNLKQRLTD